MVPPSEGQSDDEDPPDLPARFGEFSGGVTGSLRGSRAGENRRIQVHKALSDRARQVFAGGICPPNRDSMEKNPARPDAGNPDGSSPDSFGVPVARILFSRLHLGPPPDVAANPSLTIEDESEI